MSQYFIFYIAEIKLFNGKHIYENHQIFVLFKNNFVYFISTKHRIADKANQDSITSNIADIV